MMGHLVTGRYGPQDETATFPKKGWLARLWRNLLARAFTRSR